MADSTLIVLRPGGGRFLVGQGSCLLAAGPDGFATGPEDGFFAGGARLLSRLRWLVDGEVPLPAGLAAVEQDSWMGYYARPGTLELRLSRFVGPGLHEDADATNYSRERVSFELSLELEAGFAAAAGWRAAEDGWELSFDSSDGRLGVSAVFSRCPAPARTERGVAFKIALEPGARWHACLDATARLDGAAQARAGRCLSFPRPRSAAGEARAEALRTSARFSARGASSLAPAVLAVLERGRKDLAGLRLHDLDARRGWTVAAGLPRSPCLLGGDALASARQAALCGPEMMVGALAALAPQQGSGCAGSTAQYPIALSELWRWTGDKELAGRFVVPALEALACLDRHSDPDGDGFYEREGPLALCEDQGEVYLAKRRMSELLWWLGRKADGKRLKREARELKARFNAAFWLEGDGAFARGLDARKSPIRAATSDPARCLECGIVDSSRARRVADRLMAGDLFSGWGARTLSSRDPGYDPYARGRGSVRPADQGVLAAALARYGLHEHLERLARGLFEAAALFEHRRLPELFGGQSSAEQPFPALCPDACWPQACAASAPFAVVQALLGLAPYAALDLLVVDPRLPEWLPELIVEDLRVGKSRATIRFYRRGGGGGDYRVLAKHGPLRVVRQPSPWSLTSGVVERVGGLVKSLAPSR